MHCQGSSSRSETGHCSGNLGSAPTTYFYGRVGSLSQKVRKFLVVSGRVWSYFGRVFGRFLVAFQNEILKENVTFLMAFMASFFIVRFRIRLRIS